MLDYYLQQVQLLLRDTKEEEFNTADLRMYINLGRNKIAADAQCIRQLVPSFGSFATVSGGGGSGYGSAPAVTVTPPDAYGVGYTQAVITASVAGGVVTGYVLVTAGTGYVNPTVTLSGGGGSGATIDFTLTPFLTTYANQETYTFAAASALITAEGIGGIFAVQNVSMSWGSLKPTLRWMDWSGFQAYLRSQNLQSTNWPTVWAQYGEGTQGSIYLYPIPSQTMQMDWDCYCLPKWLASDSDFEALPYPWTEAVPFYAAYIAHSGKNLDMANYFEQKYRLMVKEARAWVSPAMVPDFYQGRF